MYKAQLCEEEIEANMQADFRMLKSGDAVVIGVSGGADSVCLFHLLVEERKRKQLRLQVVHVNHGLREEAAQEERFVEQLCDTFQVPFRAFHVDVPAYAKMHGLGCEEAGRELRYAAFRETAKDVFGKDAYIAVAHHRLDQAETVLFRLFRGTGLLGLTGMKRVEKDLIRPLLSVGRAEIEAYLEAHGYAYKVDQSNLSDAYARNRIRNTILPYAQKEICQGAVEHIAEAAEKLASAQEYLAAQVEALAERALRGKEEELLVLEKEVRAAHPYLQGELMREALTRVSGSKKDITSKHIEIVGGLWGQQVGHRLQLPYGVVALRRQEGIAFFKACGKEAEQIAEIHLTDVSENEAYCVWGAYEIRYRLLCRAEGALQVSEAPKNRYTKWFNYDKMTPFPSIRGVRSEDRLEIDDKGHTKRVVDILKDLKIPADKRQKLPVLVCGDVSVWCLGYRMNEAFKVKEDTQYILEVQVIHPQIEEENDG